MERTQRVAKLEALLARVQSRSNRGDTHGNAAVALAQPAAAPVARIAAAPAPAPVVHAPPPQIVAPSPKPSPVAASAPPPAAVARPPVAAPPVAAHEMQEEVATVVRDVPHEALAAIAAATAEHAAPAKAPPAAGAPPPAAAATPAAATPAFRGTSAFGGLSKKMTLIGTAPPANWPPRGAETSTPPPAPEPAAEAPVVDEAKSSVDDAPSIQASESEGDVDALLGDENSAPPAPAVEEIAEKPAVAAAPAITQASSAVAIPRAIEPVAPQPIKKTRSATTVIAMIALWIMLLAVIWFVYKSSM